MFLTQSLPGYEIIEVVHTGKNTIIYRAWSQKLNQYVILKFPQAEYPNLEQIARLKYEYNVIAGLSLQGVLKIHRLEIYQNIIALVYEDFHGQSLRHFLSIKKLSLISFLKIAVQLARALETLHNHQIIHKDIKPANIIINPTTEIVKLADFSIASRLSQETPQLNNYQYLEGTLTYISPEQTGRMNRSLDYRSDFYSLGVTFYEMLTGKLPFASNDPLELVYCHIAKQPPAIHELHPDIPIEVIQIVKKLMEKNAEDRYQTANGLLADLETCLSQVAINNKITGFTLGRLDVLSRLLIPQKLYGRETEINLLLTAFQRVSDLEDSAHGSRESEMLLVSGYSGMGKSAIVHEINKPITSQRGYFVSGKFDQFKQNIPYAALIQAFGTLMQQLFTEPPAALELWGEKILTALGTNGQVIIDVIPEVELIIGQQPELPKLGSVESQNRFNRIFKEFIRIFAQKQHPLAIFLDDLQWADSATLKLIQSLMTDNQTKHLLFIGAYRDNEVNPAHPLMQMVESIENSGTIVNQIVLSGLSLEHVTQLLCETLNWEDKIEGSPNIKELAALLWYKTGGNPFFLTQMLQTLEREKLLTFNFAQGKWHWNIQQILSLGITDLSVVELVASNICQQPPLTQELLKLAACIGDRFGLDVLATTSKRSPSQVVGDLWPALQKGLILPLSNDYKVSLSLAPEELQKFGFDQSQLQYCFLHDRVQQAAYSLIPENQKQATHLEIGRLLLCNIPHEELLEHIFDVVNQLNRASDLICEIDEKIQLANLNQMAGNKALKAAAFEPAYNYFTQGMALLPENSWLDFYNLTVELYLGAAEAAYLHTDFAATKAITDIALAQIHDIQNKAKISELQILYHHTQSQFPEAVQVAVQILGELGEEFPANPDTESFLLAFSYTQQLISQTGFEQLEHLPSIQNAIKWCAIKILRRAFSPAFFGVPQMLGFIICRLVDLTILYGESSLTPYAFTVFSILLNGSLHDVALGSKFGDLAIAIHQRQNSLADKTAVFALYYGLSAHFYQPVQSCIQPLIAGYLSFSESGDAEHAAYCIVNAYFCSILGGETLEKVEKNFAKFIQHIVEFKQEQTINQLYVWTQAIHNLMGLSAQTALLKGNYFDIEVMLPQLVASQNFNTVNYVNIAQSMLYYIFGEYELAYNHAVQTEPYLGASSGKFLIYAHNFYYSLSLAALYPTASTPQQAQFWEKLQANQERMQKWAEFCPENFSHKYLLVKAEIARITGDELTAIDLYDLAIASAKENGFIQNAALASELAANFWLSKKKAEFARIYLIKAYYSYIQWGGVAKVKNLLSLYPWLASQTHKPSLDLVDLTDTLTTTTSNNSLGNFLDLATFIKISQVITSEIILENLLCKLIQILLENMAAQTGFLLLVEANHLCIKASGTATDEKVIIHTSGKEIAEQLPNCVINYVSKTRQHISLNDATLEKPFNADSYIQKVKPKSILCAPIIYQSQLQGIIYLENNLTTGVFTSERVEVMNILVSQIAIAIENARLYTQQQEKSQELENSLQKLQKTQSQLIQHEKMSSLGQLVAGIAHEINNPVNFISGNLNHAGEYIQDLLSLVELYQYYYHDPDPAVTEKIHQIDLDFLLGDLPKLLTSMKVGAERIQAIVRSLRNFSRLDEAEVKAVDIHEGIDNTLMILQYRLKAKPDAPSIQIIKEYGNLPLIECYAGQLNQVFMNIISNAIDALQDEHQQRSLLSIQQEVSTITIRTQSLNDDLITIHIIDNGAGMTDIVRQRLFEPFFTTKAIGKGTGLGLSISHQIVCEKHQGSLECHSTLGKGSEFVIKIPIQQREKT